MRNKVKNKFTKCCAGVLALSVLLSNAQIVLADEVNKSDNEQWKLVWNDEFDGNELDLTKWSYETGNWIVDDDGNKVDSGWGNNELEYYTEGDNLEVKDGNLVITARKEEVSDAVQGNFDYTSSRIVTRDNYSKKYGRFEARIKLPEGNGLWPAFWMMPQDDSYGAWAASGEIDIMEARGSELDSVEGTLHYGGKWPTNKYTGEKYEIPNGGEITDFHDYAVEWEPGEIRWYVDGVLCSTQNNWYSIDENGEKYSFSAPFDQEFYLILNLALGGWFAGMNPDEDFSEAEMIVDYVRVYDKVSGYEEVTEEPQVEKEPLPDGAKLPIDGNYIYDVNFETGFNDVTSGDTTFTNKWNFVRLPDFGGAATITTENVNDNNFSKINVTNGGSQPYSVQLIQYVTMTKGHSYKLSYDAKSNTNREISIKVSGGEDRGYATYSENYSASLTSEVKHFEHVFTMAADSDINARLEFNVGSNTNPVWIGNIVLEEVEIVEDHDAIKEPLKNGNYIYNGTFDKGTIDRKTYWNLENNNEASANYSVKEDTRELFIDIENSGSNVSDVVLNQKGIRLEKNGDYTLTFNARGFKESLLKNLFNNSKNITISIKNSEGNIIYSEDISVEIGSEMKEYTVSFSTGETLDKNGTIEFLVGGNNIGLYLDDVFLKNNSSQDLGDKVIFPLKNGEFSQGLACWDSWSVVGATSTSEDNKAVINIPNKFWEAGDGAEKWAVQFKQTGLQVYNDVEYIVSFDASSTVERDIELVAQNGGYYRHFEKQVSIGTETKRYTYSFKPTGDDIVELNFLLGKYGDYEPHSITIDNVVFEIKDYSNNKFENYNFEDGVDPWFMWSDSGASDSVNNGKWDIDIPNVGSEFWSVQAIHENINLEKGKSYRLTFDMSSSIPRKIQAILEGGSKYLCETIEVNEELKTYTVEFTHTEDTNSATKFLFALGNIEGQGNLNSHNISIDNVYLYEVPDFTIDEPTETVKIITSMEPTEGPQINVNGDGGCGFTFPIFNNGTSTFDDIKDDLQVLVKENNEYVAIDSSSTWKYDVNFGHFWDGPGGYWFNPVKETSYIKLVSKDNPQVFIEYTLYVEEINNQSIISIEPTQGPNINVGEDRGCGFTFPIFNNGEASFSDIEEDLEMFVYKNNQWISFDNIESGFIYDTNFGHFWDGEGGYWFNPIEETEYIKLASKENDHVYIVYTLAVGEYDFVSEVVLDKTNVELTEIGATEALIATVLPVDATNKNLNWNSSNVEIATVNEEGVITAVANGTALITVRTFDGNKIAECTVTVNIENEEDQKLADEVIDKINKLPAEITLANKDEVNALRVEYEALTETQKSLITQDILEKLILAEAKILELEAEVEVNNNAAKKVEEIIKALPEIINLANRGEVKAARTAYEALTEVQKSLIAQDILEKLISAEAKILELEAEVEVNNNEAKKVEEMVKALPENVTLANKDEVKAARVAYEALTKAQKSLVSQEILEKLVLAEAKILELEKENSNSGIDIVPDKDNSDDSLPKTGGVNSLYLLFAGAIAAIGGVIVLKGNKKTI